MFLMTNKIMSKSLNITHIGDIFMITKYEAINKEEPNNL